MAYLSSVISHYKGAAKERLCGVVYWLALAFCVTNLGDCHLSTTKHNEASTLLRTVCTGFIDIWRRIRPGLILPSKYLPVNQLFYNQTAWQNLRG